VAVAVASVVRVRVGRDQKMEVEVVSVVMLQWQHRYQKAIRKFSHMEAHVHRTLDIFQ